MNHELQLTNVYAHNFTSIYAKFETPKKHIITH